MITYERYKLDNGLTVLLHVDHDTPMVTVNTLYRVGSRDESPERTGFAHLFEHLMFGGTPRIADYDGVVNNIGGECNATTNNDFTNYYVTAPSRFLHEMIDLEADRMRGLDFSEHVLNVQQQVVTEEYHQRYTNQPYGDKWLLLRPLCYKHHHYRWCTIGADIRHVQEATVDDERNFFKAHYFPANAILAITGDIDIAETLRLVHEAYDTIESPQQPMPSATPTEPVQRAQRRLEVHREVPYDVLYMAFPMCDRLHPDFVVYDLISDVLSNGKSSRMYSRLVKECNLFNDINAYITGDRDAGLFVIDGKPAQGVSLYEAEEAVWQVLKELCDNGVDDYELNKVANKFESTFAFSHYRVADRAANLCYYEFLDRLHWINDEPAEYRKVTPARLQSVARYCFTPAHANIIHYHAQTPTQ